METQHVQEPKVKADYQCLAIRDNKAMHFLPPFFVRNIPTAIRSLTEEAQKSDKSMLHRFPGDYSLFRLGEFFDDHGSIDVLAQPEKICDITDLLELKPEVKNAAPNA